MEEVGTCYRCFCNRQRVTVVLAALSVALLTALIVVVVVVVNKDEEADERGRNSFPCPPKKKGLLTSGEPVTPDPFHDVTVAEYARLYSFLRSQPQLNLVSPAQTAFNTSSIFMVDLLLPPKQRVLAFLDAKGPQPPREARVMIFRGDKQPQVVEEYRVGPLSEPTYAELIVNPQRRNPVPISVRPEGGIEFEGIDSVLLPKIDRKVGYILKESYGSTLTDCLDSCLTYINLPVGSHIHGDINIRKMWLMGAYYIEYYSLYSLDFGVRVTTNSSDPDLWKVDKVWYSGTLYDSLEQLAERYENDPAMKKTRIPFPKSSLDLKSTQALRGDPAPETPERPPVQVEPDGKRYTIEHRHVHYLHWDFHVRLSSFTGPQVYDVRFQGDRIAYEVSLSEVAVFYSGHSASDKVMDFVDSEVIMGINTKSLVPGADCPEGATILNYSFLGQAMAEPQTNARAMCVFELNTGVPLRRHLSYATYEGGFYGGMADSALVVRSILTLYNYDYVIDFIFHQSGALETRAISTGYIMSTFYEQAQSPYGFQLDENMNANIHHHMFHFKADVDIGGTSNRYETLDIRQEETPLPQISPTATKRQLTFQRNLRRTENESVYHYNFDTPKYHIVHNDQKRTKYNVPRAYRLQMNGMAKQLLPPGRDNERTIPWARQQLAVTVHKDDEAVSSSPYAMFDSQNPVTDFTNFISDESIVDEDLVLWVTLGVHHIPHTEDLPVTPTVGGHLAFFLLPYNYFPECPSVSSRDGIRVDYVTPGKPADGVKVERNGNRENGVCGAVSLEQIVRQRPDDILQTHRDFKLL